MKKLLSIKLSRADTLLVAATVVAALRLMLINAVFIGFNVKEWSWFAPAEVWSGLAFAVLEGVALAYISKRWRKIEPKRRSDWVYWSILLVGQLLLLVSIVGVTGFAATAIRRGMSIDVMLGNYGSITWSMFVTAINPLLVILIGIVEDDSPGQPQQSTVAPYAALVRQAQARGILDAWQNQNGTTQTPRVAWLVKEFWRQIGGDLPAAEADQAIIDWRSRNGISGRRPAELEPAGRNGTG